MSLSRRSFLRTGTAAALLAGLSFHPLKSVFAQDGGDPKGYFQTPQEAKTERPFYFTKTTFEPHINTDFSSRFARLVTTLRLVAVEDCPAPPSRAAGGECFSLTFRADRELSSLTTIHPMEHAALGEFSLFVSQTKRERDPEGIYYVAVINHRVESGPRQ